jgi:hypothetical protein
VSAELVGAHGALERLRTLLLSHGGLIASLLAPRVAVDGTALRDNDAAGDDGATPPPSPAALAASGPRAAGDRDEYELLIEAIYEGYLLHYGSPRILVAPEADLGLLAGDQLYAIGLARLVTLGDTFAVGELADTITLSALAQGSGQPELADAVWQAGALAVGWGPTETHRDAKQMMLAGSPEAIEAMRTSGAPRAARG